jgi:shikimate dehydrogenase
MSSSVDSHILGIIGYPIGHSLSPLMHNTAIKSLSLGYRYFPFQVKPEELKDALKDFRSREIKGLNVTIPHKESVIDLLDEIEPDARLIGAVNTINREGDRLVGYNTDGKGFVQSLRKDAKTEPKGKAVLMLGAGGAARGLAIQLALEKVEKIIIVNRTLKRAELLAEDVKEKAGFHEASAISLEDKAVADYLSDSDIVINTTSIGMKKGDPPVLPYDCISKKHLICDIVYNPLETDLLREARKRGAAVLNGLGMLIYQGDLSFEIWTGRTFPVDLVKKALMDKLSEAGS